MEQTIPKQPLGTTLLFVIMYAYKNEEAKKTQRKTTGTEPHRIIEERIPNDFILELERTEDFQNILFTHLFQFLVVFLRVEIADTEFLS